MSVDRTASDFVRMLAFRKRAHEHDESRHPVSTMKLTTGRSRNVTVAGHGRKGPQVGSRTSPPCAVVMRCLMRPSVETTASTPRPPSSVA